MASNMQQPIIGSLPTGFKVIFDPTDEEIILHYLWKKVRGKRLPCNEVIECDLYGECHVWKMLFEEKGRDVMYFFTRLKKKSSKSSRIERATECGTWRSQSDAKIYYRGDVKQPIGSKRSFSFVPRKGGGGDDLKGWVMHEYRLDGYLLKKKADNNDNNNCYYMDDYVLCRMKRKVKRSDQVNDHRVENFQNNVVPTAAAAPMMMMVMEQQQRQQEEEVCNNVTTSAVATNYGDAANSETLMTHCYDMSDTDYLAISVGNLRNDHEITSCFNLPTADLHQDNDNKRVGIQEVHATVSFSTNSIIERQQQQQQQQLSGNNRADNERMKAIGLAGLDSNTNNDSNDGKEEEAYLLEDFDKLSSTNFSGSMSLFIRNH